MTETDFATIEGLLGIRLPRTYRRVMAAYPFGGDRPSEAYMPDDAAYVCSLNREILEDELPNDWQSCFFAIGTSWGGDAHVLDTSLDESPVYQFSQETGERSTLAPTLDDWVGKLLRWYVHFDAVAAAAEYKQLASAMSPVETLRIEAGGSAGFHMTSPEPMDGWHRVVVSSERGGGTSFWIAVIKQQWFIGFWSGELYRIDDSVSAFCVASLMESLKASSDLSREIQNQFYLQAVTDAKFDQVVSGQ